MVEDFLKHYTQKIVANKDAVSIKKTMKEMDFCEIEIYVASSDVGRLIGKDGKMISAIKTFISACKAKDGISYKVSVQSNT
ncbi:RNA-binding protein [Helicobacter sp. 13S00401-1]|uniref:KH domain-containing protein n=1 Tax=Helicobacter sp. 13S00401-1 TaxID=1905758 RepID=UPI000BA5D488|nr:KH domain-containing protein [Helicobacter sp. 13S00401-1]PAF50894.1 RNA-binding protein [Helicobacter sp. 13S00401-1]